MRVKYCCDAKAYENYYLSQVGHGMPYFAGARVQQVYGLGNLFSSIAKSVVPLVKNDAKTLGKQVLQSGVEFASDVLQGKNVKQLPSTKPKQQVRISYKRPNKNERRHREKYKRKNARNITTFLREP